MFSDSKSFVAAETNRGALRLYKNGQFVKAIKFGGYRPLVKLINDEIVTDDLNGELAILNENLDVLKTFGVTKTALTGSLAGNDKFIALADLRGTVGYYSRYGSYEAKVSKIINFKNYLLGYLQT